jgi:predicted adenine nucleotide alpha hydrolase (AANH) superfamily ATPase
MKSVLIHCCCAHCTAYTITYWRQQGYEVTALWYNPNIHPYTEHQQRLEAMSSLAKQMDFPLIIAKGYDVIDYFRKIVGHEVGRCRYCFWLRLKKTAETAIKYDFSAFTTSLFISPHQEHDLLRKTGNELAEEIGIQFFYTDLRKYYSDSRRITKPLNLYRQQYCGCLYSEWERYTDVKIE